MTDWAVTRGRSDLQVGNDSALHLVIAKKS